MYLIWFVLYASIYLQKLTCGLGLMLHFTGLKKSFDRPLYFDAEGLVLQDGLLQL